MINLLESLIGDGESPFLKTISRCLESRHLDLVRTCLITVTWLSSSLSKQYNAGLHLPAFLAVISQLKEILLNSELELKTLASMSLFNFSKISGSTPSSFIFWFVIQNTILNDWTKVILCCLISCKLFVECRTLLKIMAQDMAPVLHGLVDVIWTAKKLHAILM